MTKGTTKTNFTLKTSKRLHILQLKIANLFKKIVSLIKIHVVLLRNRGAPMHLKISNREGKYILGINSRPYDTIPEMIHHYSMHMLNIKGAEHVKLKYPVFQENMYFTVEPGS